MRGAGNAARRGAAGRAAGAPRGATAGFSLIETLVATALLLIVSGVVSHAIMQMTRSQATIWNRTEMHSGVRSATELLQQEVGQAGRVILPAGVRLTASVASLPSRTLTVNSTAYMFPGELLTIDTGSFAGCTAGCPETVKIASVDSATQITVDNTLSLWLGQAAPGLLYTHAAGAPVAVYGGFATGIVPDTRPNGTAYPNGSSGTRLKLYGDINGDGTMVYVEYFCDPLPGGSGNLYRTMVTLPASALAPVPAKPAPGPAQVLLGNVLQNPNNTPCFTYQKQSVGADSYVVDVAITLTVQTEQPDPVTRQFQTETKALLNVSPRNIVNVWQYASSNPGATDRIQPMPPAVQALLP